jgi:hypothetical protein
MPGVVFTHNNSVGNLERGLGERLFMVPDGDGFSVPPRPAEFGCEEYANRVLSKMPKFDGPISGDEFVALYDGPKKKRYQQALNNVVQRGLLEDDANIRVFIKDEKICSWIKVDPAPRLISPRTPEYCLELGRYIKPIEHLLYKAVARVWKEKTIFKGLNFGERGMLLREKWDSFQDPVAIGLDASRFDQHVSVPALKWEHDIYLRCFTGGRKYLKYLLSQQLHNKGRTYVDGCEVKYEVDGGRMSGDMNTALGNCLIMTGLVWHYAREKGLVVKLANDGDDCVVFMERADLESFMEGLCGWFRLKGFTMKVEKPVFVFEELEFCQCHPVWNGDQWTMCRNLHKALFTDCVHVGRTLPEILAIRAAISDSGLAWSRGMPIFPSFYKHIRKTSDATAVSKDTLARLVNHSGTYWNSQGCSSGTQETSCEARLSFYRAFGVSPIEQEAIEQYYDALPLGDMRFSESSVVYNPEVPCCEYPLFIDQALNTIIFT